MRKSVRLLAAGVLAAGVSVAAPGCASGYYGSYTAQRSYRDFERVAYDNGYREGLAHGEHDARDRRDFRVDRDRDYRRADEGYRHEYGDRDFYRQAFRRGYEIGYREGYGRFARGGYDAPYVQQGPPVAVPPPVAVYPGAPGPYTQRRDGRFGSAAAQAGYRDGLDAGRDAAHDRRAFDPIREKRYREGDHDYDRRYGPRDDYKREYRAAFEQGYRDGYGARRW